MGRGRSARSSELLRIGCELALDFFRAWRGDHDAIDALVLLAVTRANVDGIVYSRELRTRFGGRNPIAPDDLRQPISIEILAQGVRLPVSLVRKRVQGLEARDKCRTPPAGMLITEQQVEASHRLRVVEEVYELLRRTERQLQGLGFLDTIQLPPGDEGLTGPPVRSAAAHGARYVLRLLGSVAAPIGDYVDALLVLELLRSDGRMRSPSQLAAVAGLSPSVVARRLGRLVSDGVCTRERPGRVVCPADAAWLQACEARNEDDLFQLFAGLSEVGALTAMRRG
ncbi:winged helix-turn-helix domain-containing protein [Phenylobacterium sp.]|uniref:winged helix-turn-helix domain-containing protein n=1 Tax=Phenylobacterium sp. TaxID=1871053 RepID=UPI0025CD2C66|nr:winged helix-turn-helix domain-containing protein [Phenylobacterium sp.]